MLDALSKCKIAVNRRSIERVIQHIRINNLIKGLMATHNGYFIANSKEELMAYEKSLLDRELSLRNLRICIEKQRAELFAETVPTHKKLL